MFQYRLYSHGSTPPLIIAIFLKRITMSSLFLSLSSVAFLLLLLSYIKSAYHKGLRSLPGPFWARFSGLYRLSMVYKGDGPERYRDIHERYGAIVRVGPSHVSVSDVAMVPVIYGIGSKFSKVRLTHLEATFSNKADCILHNYGTDLPRQGHG